MVGTSVVTSASPDAVLAERERQRRLLAFLVLHAGLRADLALYGWEELGPRLRDLIRHERWAHLGAVLSDEVLDTLVPCGTFEELPALLLGALRRGLGQGILVSPPADDRGRRRLRCRHSSRPRRLSLLEERTPQPAMGKMSSSSAMASMAAARSAGSMPR